jgi:hypothetical protein
MMAHLRLTMLRQYSSSSIFCSSEMPPSGAKGAKGGAFPYCP